MNVKRTTCSACGSDKLHQFLDLGSSPVADAYTSAADEVSKTYPLEVAVCTDCHLAQLLEVIDSETLFGTGYSFYSSSSPPLSDYHRRYAQRITRQLREDPEMEFILEIGCNDGDMLRWFDDPKWTTLGVDPAAGPVAVARQRGLHVLQEEFTDQLAHEIYESNGSADVVIANHVLAHVADVGDMLRGIASILARFGVAYVEVQYVADLLVNNAFDLVYHEHRNFFSLASLMAAAEHVGLTVVDAEFTRRQQGSLRVQLRHANT
jgi:ubiquinone/menaquinone biosynthesis C-methylase UbiE